MRICPPFANRRRWRVGRTEMDAVAAAWQGLAAEAERLRGRSLAALWRDPRRRRALSFRLGAVACDFSRHYLDAEALAALLRLAAATRVEAQVQRLLRGDPVNFTEQRPALHTALRSDARRLTVRGRNIMAPVRSERERMLAFADTVRRGRRRGSGGARIDTVVNVGIGGSELGPRLVCEALRPPQPDGGISAHFTGGMDGVRTLELLQRLNAESTLVIVASKSGTTRDTLDNAGLAVQWLRHHLGARGWRRHLLGVSARPAALADLGIPTAQRFRIWDWVGGRFSLWSCMGLVCALALGRRAFNELLAGARSADRHLQRTPPARNLPVLMALVDLWNISLLGVESRIVLPYTHGLRGLPSYLTQLEMESLGKAPPSGGGQRTTCAVWGDLGYNARHTFFQALHQGTLRAALDLLLVERPVPGAPARTHRLNLVNARAQLRWLCFGKRAADPGQRYRGGNAASVFTLRSLTPRALGTLLALYEHKVYVQAVLWGINAFDQHAVDVGKT